MKIDLTHRTRIARLFYISRYHLRKAKHAKKDSTKRSTYIITLENIKKKFRIDGPDRDAQFEKIFEEYCVWLQNKVCRKPQQPIIYSSNETVINI